LCPSWQISKDQISVESERTDEDQSLRIVMIDFGQAVERGHPAAAELLKRDLQTVRDFFVKQGIQTLSVEDSEEFVLTPFSSNADDNEIAVEEKSASKENSEDSDTWRHSVPGWDDQKVMDELLAKLQAMNTTAK
jgi:serine/threonine-protein kinase RIO1